MHITDVYYIAFPLDNYKMKMTVTLVYILEVAQLTLCTYDAFRLFSSGWGNSVELDSIGLEWLSVPILGVFSKLFPPRAAH